MNGYMRLCKHTIISNVKDIEGALILNLSPHELSRKRGDINKIFAELVVTIKQFHIICNAQKVMLPM